MGVWGVGITQDDAFAETCEQFKDALQSGRTPKSIAEELLLNCTGNPEAHIIFMAVADCLWHCKQLSDEMRQEIERLIEKEVDLNYWRELGATEQMLQRRKKALWTFLRRMQSEPNSKQVWKQAMVNAKKYPEKGDVFWYRSSGDLYGAVILDVQQEDYLVAISERLETIPTQIDTVLKAQLYTVAWCSCVELLSSKRMHVIACINIEEDFSNRAGLGKVFIDGELIKWECYNCGQSSTWKHCFRSLTLHDTFVFEVLDPKRLPKFYSRQHC